MERRFWKTVCVCVSWQADSMQQVPEECVINTIALDKLASHIK